MSLEVIKEMWQSHYIIGTLIALIIIAFIYEVYMIPFRIRDFFDMKEEEIKRRRSNDYKILNILSCIMMQQHCKFKTDNIEDYNRQLESFAAELNKLLYNDEEEQGEE